MGQDSILEAMKDFSGRTLIAIQKGANGLFEKKLNDGLMILVGSAIAHFDSAKEGKNVLAGAVMTPGGPELEIQAHSVSWGQIINWMKESFEEACTAGLDLSFTSSNIRRDPNAHSQGLVEFNCISGYLPQELQFLTELDKPVPLLTVAKKLQEAWIPSEKENEPEEES